MMRNLLLLLMIVTLFIAGCRANSEPKSPEEANVTMELSIAPNPPVVGAATLVVTLQDRNGNPINDAKVGIRGDMNHAGMTPVIGEQSEGENGEYRIPFEWTMGGDWFVVVTATLRNGTVVEQQFDYAVSGEMDVGGMDMSEGGMDNTELSEGGMDGMDMGADIADIDSGAPIGESEADEMDMSETESGDDTMEMGNDSLEPEAEDE